MTLFISDSMDIFKVIKRIGMCIDDDGLNIEYLSK